MNDAPFIGMPTPNDNYDDFSFLKACRRGYTPVYLYYIGAVSKERPVVLSEWIYTSARAQQMLTKIQVSTPEAGIFSAICWFNPELENDCEDLARTIACMRRESIEWAH